MRKRKEEEGRGGERKRGRREEGGRGREGESEERKAGGGVVPRARETLGMLKVPRGSRVYPGSHVPPWTPRSSCSAPARVLVSSWPRGCRCGWAMQQPSGRAEPVPFPGGDPGPSGYPAPCCCRMRTSKPVRNFYKLLFELNRRHWPRSKISSAPERDSLAASFTHLRLRRGQFKEHYRKVG